VYDIGLQPCWEVDISLTSNSQFSQL